MRYNRIVRNYWLDFTFRSKRLQEDQLEAAHTRIETMLAHDYVLDIVGQSKTTINFNRVLDSSYILLVKLSSHLSDESKRIIGTFLVSELLHAIQHRTTRNQFCIYIDEFQNFAGFQDFPILITQAPKFGIATTLAHHERYGQLFGNPQILGATAAIANKVLFQVTPRDASELAPEFADKPPTETRREEQFIISRAPIYDLLKWHDNPKIREYVNKYIRPMKERLEDITGEAETERLIRTEYLDEASMYRLDNQIEGVDRITADYQRQRGSLMAAGQSTTSASGRTRRLISLNEEVRRIRIAFRELNKLLTAIMERKIEVGSTRFNDFLFNAINGMRILTDVERQTLKYYFLVTALNPMAHFMPYDVAKSLNRLTEKQKKEEEKRADFYWRLHYMYKAEPPLVKADVFIADMGARTEHDMIGERARELMALPKYTVYVRKLEGVHSTGIYKTTTKALPETTADIDDIDLVNKRTREFGCRRRYDIQDEIYNRQMPEIDESEPPPLWG